MGVVMCGDVCGGVVTCGDLWLRVGVRGDV